MKPSKHILVGGLLVASSFLIQGISFLATMANLNSSMSSLSVKDNTSPEELKGSINALTDGFGTSDSYFVMSTVLSMITFTVGLIFLTYGIYGVAKLVERLETEQAATRNH